MDVVSIFEKFGLPIAFLIVVLWLYIDRDKKSYAERKEWQENQENLRKDHQQERKEWQESQQSLQRDTNTALRDLTQVISKMK